MLMKSTFVASLVLGLMLPCLVVSCAISEGRRWAVGTLERGWALYFSQPLGHGCGGVGQKLRWAGENREGDGRDSFTLPEHLWGLAWA